MTEIRINNELFCKHDGMWLILENDCSRIVKETNDRNVVEIIAEDLKIKGELVSLSFEDEKYTRLVRTQPQYLEFHIKTKYLEDITFGIRIKSRKYST